MLREARSLYVAKRSSTLLKVKTFFDAEAIVIGYEPGKVIPPCHPSPVVSVYASYLGWGYASDVATLTVF